MSVSFKFGSVDTVTSQYIIPVIDLCSDDDMKMVEKGDKCALKCDAVEFQEYTSGLHKNRRKMKFSDSTMEVLFDSKQKKVMTDVKEYCGNQGTEINVSVGKKGKRTTVVIDQPMNPVGSLLSTNVLLPASPV